MFIHRNLQTVSVFIHFLSFLYLDQMRSWSRTCGRIHPVFICGFVCTQLSQQTNWQVGMRDGDLFNEARGERSRESPDYKQTKHFSIFWEAMCRTFVLMRCPLVTFECADVCVKERTANNEKCT